MTTEDHTHLPCEDTAPAQGASGGRPDCGKGPAGRQREQADGFERSPEEATKTVEN